MFQLQKNEGRCCQKQVFQAGINNHIPQFTLECDYLSLSEIAASGNNVLQIYAEQYLIAMSNGRNLQYIPINAYGLHLLFICRFVKYQEKSCRSVLTYMYLPWAKWASFHRRCFLNAFS